MATTYYNAGTGSGQGLTSTTSVLTKFNFTGSNPGEAFNIQIYNANSPTQLQTLVLATGDNTINATSCPSLPQSGGMWLTPPIGNTATIKIKGIGADTGITLSPTVPFFYPFATPPPSSFVVNVSSGITVELCWI